jgi:hypothetical protein
MRTAVAIFGDVIADQRATQADAGILADTDACDV